MSKSMSDEPTEEPSVSSSKGHERNTPIILFGICAAIVTWFFGFRPFLVNGISMYPTFNAFFVTNDDTGHLIQGDYLIIDIFSYLFLHEPERFDVVVARSPIKPGRYLLKRVIGLPNERVRLSGNTVEITGENGERTVLFEPYINREKTAAYTDQVTQLGDGQYFLLGDNRSNSLDSRVWGSLTKDNIVGRVILRLYPFDSSIVFPGRVDTDR